MLQRFVEAQEDTYHIALQEGEMGRKQTHWMWFVFPQIQGLGSSWYSQYYAIKDMDEAIQYLEHPILGDRLIDITEAILNLPTNDAEKVLGCIDALKLQSSMTLFALTEKDPVFNMVLDRYFDGELCSNTLRILGM